MTTWGLSATIKAPPADILHFAAFHLEAGAHRLYLYLDAANDQAFTRLKTHPKVRVIQCDNDWWQGKRPKKHQVRQTRNATHAYRRRAEVDWLIHMDVDEFLIADHPVADILSNLSRTQTVARIRPMEQLAGDGTAFKAFIPNGPDRDSIVASLYPTFGQHIKGGFMSHLAGKVFVRTGLSDVQVKIHNVFQAGDMITGPADTPGIDLAHCHARTWQDWITAYRYRIQSGSYRADLAPNRPRDKGGVTVHDLLSGIEARQGEAGLRAFFDEICADTPALRARLAGKGLLKHANLGLNTTIDSHFPL